MYTTIRNEKDVKFFASLSDYARSAIQACKIVARNLDYKIGTNGIVGIIANDLTLVMSALSEGRSDDALRILRRLQRELRFSGDVLQSIPSNRLANQVMTPAALRDFIAEHLRNYKDVSGPNLDAADAPNEINVITMVIGFSALPSQYSFTAAMADDSLWKRFSSALDGLSGMIDNADRFCFSDPKAPSDAQNFIDPATFVSRWHTRTPNAIIWLHVCQAIMSLLTDPRQIFDIIPDSTNPNGSPIAAAKRREALLNLAVLIGSLADTVSIFPLFLFKEAVRPYYDFLGIGHVFELPNVKQFDDYVEQHIIPRDVYGARNIASNVVSWFKDAGMPSAVAFIQEVVPPTVMLRYQAIADRHDRDLRKGAASDQAKLSVKKSNTDVIYLTQNIKRLLMSVPVQWSQTRSEPQDVATLCSEFERRYRDMVTYAMGQFSTAIEVDFKARVSNVAGAIPFIDAPPHVWLKDPGLAYDPTSGFSYATGVVRKSRAIEHHVINVSEVAYGSANKIAADIASFDAVGGQESRITLFDERLAERIRHHFSYAYKSYYPNWMMHGARELIRSSDPQAYWRVLSELTGHDIAMLKIIMTQDLQRRTLATYFSSFGLFVEMTLNTESEIQDFTKDLSQIWDSLSNARTLHGARNVFDQFLSRHAVSVIPGYGSPYGLGYSDLLPLLDWGQLIGSSYFQVKDVDSGFVFYDAGRFTMFLPFVKLPTDPPSSIPDGEVEWPLADRFPCLVNKTSADSIILRDVMGFVMADSMYHFSMVDAGQSRFENAVKLVFNSRFVYAADALAAISSHSFTRLVGKPVKQLTESEWYGSRFSLVCHYACLPPLLSKSVVGTAQGDEDQTPVSEKPAFDQILADVQDKTKAASDETFKENLKPNVKLSDEVAKSVVTSIVPMIEPSGDAQTSKRDKNRKFRKKSDSIEKED